MSIKAIFFDLGGVLLRTEDPTVRANLAAEFNMQYDEIDRFVFECKTAALASVGKISEDEHWLDVTRRLNLPDSEMPRIRDGFFGGDKIDFDLINLLRGLRSTHRTGLISNAWSGMRSWINEQKLDDAFDDLIISAEFGIAKPDARIYQHALQKLNVEADDAIFVDDIEKNIKGCQSIGMHGVLFRTTQQTIAEINEFLQQ